MTNDQIESIIEGFHYGTDGGLPVDCCGVASIVDAFDAWAKKEHPDVYENAGELEPYMIDEEGIEVIAEFFTTVDEKLLPTAFEGLRDSIKSFHNGAPDPESDDPQAGLALETLTAIEAALAAG